jgi:hypothetical protein
VSTHHCRKGLTHFWVSSLCFPSTPSTISTYQLNWNLRNWDGAWIFWFVYHNKGTFPNRGSVNITLEGITVFKTSFSLFSFTFYHACVLIGESIVIYDRKTPLYALNSFLGWLRWLRLWHDMPELLALCYLSIFLLGYAHFFLVFGWKWWVKYGYRILNKWRVVSLHWGQLSSCYESC